MAIHCLKVLCVDDNRDIADSEALLLDLFGFDSRACYDGPHALEEARSFRPDAYLLDLNMPGMDGCELARELRIRFDGPPPLLIAITAKSGTDDLQRTADAGFDRHLLKPVDPMELFGLLSEIQATHHDE